MNKAIVASSLDRIKTIAEHAEQLTDDLPTILQESESTRSYLLALAGEMEDQITMLRSAVNAIT